MSVTWTRYGAPAYGTLRSTLAEIKRDDPLRPATVLVPTHLCGVIARRVLARGVGDRPGIAGLAVTTVDRLAERLAAPVLAGRGRRPVTDATLAAAWRRALTEDPGVFAAVAEHPATVRALVDAHRELRDVDEATLDAIPATGDPVAGEVVRLHRQVVGLLKAGWYDVADLRRAAVRALRERPALAAEIGSVVLFLPQYSPPGVTAVLDRLAAAGNLRVVAAATGEAGADAAVERLLRSADRPVDLEPPTATRVLHASDADDEVRCVVRTVTAAVRHFPAHRVAVLYSAAQPYARLLAEHLAAAEVPWHGVGVRPTIERTLPRALLDLLALPEHGWRRDEVLAVLAAAPVLGPDGNRVPTSRWERISRAAGVVAGDDWDGRLKTYAAQERAAAHREQAGEAPREGLVARRERDAAAAHALRDFVAGLRTRLDQGTSLRSWPELAEWALDTFRTLVGDATDERRLPEEDARAAERITRILSSLAGLGAVEETADLRALQLTLDLELAHDLPRYGRTGLGILVAPLSAAVGLDADAVFVVGLAEDLVPGRPAPHALLPEQVRAATGGQLPSQRDRIDRRHRHLLAALAAAPECMATFPRGDLRRSSSRLPSRWLLPTLRRLSGDPAMVSTGWQSFAGPPATTPLVAGSRSYAASLGRARSLASGQEWRTRAAAAARARGASVGDALAADPVVERALIMRRSRAGGTLTRFDGDLSASVGLPDPAQRPVSPTALEAWVRCPHAYFVARMLRVEPAPAPEELIQVSALDIGDLIHTALDRFFTALAETGGAPGGGTPWTAEQRALLRRTAIATAGDLAARGVTGHPVLWRQELGRILNDLDGLLDDDERLRAETGRRQERSELFFGMRGAATVDVPLPDGRLIRVKGSADRIDRAGDSIVVVDYKAGSARAFIGLGADDPTAGGTKLQLPVYAYAARAALGQPHAPASAEYWFVRKDRGKRIVLALTPQVEHAYAETVSVIVDGIAGGLFPHRPPANDGWGDFVECRYCDPDGLGMTELREQWARKRHDPRLAAYLRLVDPGALDARP